VAAPAGAGAVPLAVAGRAVVHDGVIGADVAAADAGRCVSKKCSFNNTKEPHDRVKLSCPHMYVPVSAVEEGGGRARLRAHCLEA